MPVFPPRGGGQLRVFHLYRSLTSVFDVELVTLGRPDAPASRREIAPALTETRVRMSAEHALAEAKLEAAVGTAITDVALPRLHNLTPDLGDALRAAARDADVVVASHPYVTPALREATDKPLWYEAQDVEALLKSSVLPESVEGAALLDDVEEVEARCCAEASLIMTCSSEDSRALAKLYDPDPSKFVEVPNGTDTEATAFVSGPRRAALRRMLSMDADPLAIFVASWHPPNIDAARALIQLAPELGDMQIMIVGSVGAAFAGQELPPNVQVTGVVSEGFKQSLLAVASAGLNPITTGSGTNLKMLEYFAAGVPVVSTELGLRGLGGLRPMTLTGDVASFPRLCRRLAEEDPDVADERTTSARAIVERDFGWPSIGRRFITALHERGWLDRSSAAQPDAGAAGG